MPSSPPRGMTRREPWFCDIGRSRSPLDRNCGQSGVGRRCNQHNPPGHTGCSSTCRKRGVPSLHYGADDLEGTRGRRSPRARGMRGAPAGPLSSPRRSPPPIWTGAIPATGRSHNPPSGGRSGSDRGVTFETSTQALFGHGGGERHGLALWVYAGRSSHPAGATVAGLQPSWWPAERPHRLHRGGGAATGVPRSRLVGRPRESDVLLGHGACLARLLPRCDRYRAARRSIVLRAALRAERPWAADRVRSRAGARPSTHGGDGLAPLGWPAFDPSTVGFMLTEPIAFLSSPRPPVPAGPHNPDLPLFYECNTDHKEGPACSESSATRRSPQSSTAW